MGPSSKDFFDQNGIFGEKVAHLGGTSPYALICEYPQPLRVKHLKKYVQQNYHFEERNCQDSFEALSWCYMLNAKTAK